MSSEDSKGHGRGSSIFQRKAQVSAGKVFTPMTKWPIFLKNCHVSRWAKTQPSGRLMMSSTLPLVLGHPSPGCPLAPTPPHPHPLQPRERALLLYL